MIRGIIDNALDRIVAATNDRVLRDNGKEVILSDRDRVALIAAMEVARAVDEAYREEDGISIPADDFAKGGAWCRAANLLKARLKLHGGDLVHRILMAAVTSKTIKMASLDNRLRQIKLYSYKGD